MKNRPLDPRNLDAAAAMITTRAEETVALIAARRAALDKRGRQDTPLVVLIGEAHTMPCHALYEMQVVDGLVRKGLAPAVALESEHGTLERAFRKARHGFSPTPAQAALLEERDRDGALSLTASLACDLHLNADLTHNVFRRFLKERRIPACLNDADTVDDRYLDLKNRRVRNAFNACARGPLPPRLEADDAPGIHVRNIHMAEMGRAFASAREARVMIQVCGASHIAGYTPEWFSPSEGLAAAYKARGMAVLALLVETHGVFGLRSLPPGHGLKRGETKLVRGLPQAQAIYDPYRPGAEVRGQIYAQLQTAEEEAAFVNGILTRNGLGEHALTPKGRSDLQLENMLEMSDIMEKIVRDARVSAKRSNLKR